jgi:D-alanyl-D-alanine carboxypeptidase (penicillin-binding protein 5/6)
MNKKARALGMKRSTFKNANGLPAPGQFTTARDMLTLARRYLADYPGNLRKFHRFSTLTYKSKFSSNANPLLGVLEGADGLKTGYVAASGYNFIATARRGNQRYIGVILGAPSSAVRAVQSRSLMEACFTDPGMFADRNTREKSKKSAQIKRKGSGKSTKNIKARSKRQEMAKVKSKRQELVREKARQQEMAKAKARRQEMAKSRGQSSTDRADAAPTVRKRPQQRSPKEDAATNKNVKPRRGAVIELEAWGPQVEVA